MEIEWMPEKKLEPELSGPDKKRYINTAAIGNKIYIGLNLHSAIFNNAKIVKVANMASEKIKPNSLEKRKLIKHNKNKIFKYLSVLKKFDFSNTIKNSGRRKNLSGKQPGMDFIPRSVYLEKINKAVAAEPIA